ncbi:MAG TPA: helix-turn-helix transcriptional regulator [Micromonosporaceae bacterium]|nr:helix-turn-helix transcriptional regulator [Micromonosporaceae bacterium]
MRNVDGAVPGAWAELVKAMRSATGMSGAELARRLEVDRATIWRWEAGRQRPENSDLVHRFAQLFSLDLDEALDAAGLRPASARRPDRERPVPMDPDLKELLRKLADPSTSPATKDFIRRTLSYLASLPDAPTAEPPRRHRKGA